MSGDVSWASQEMRDRESPSGAPDGAHSAALGQSASTSQQISSIHPRIRSGHHISTAQDPSADEQGTGNQGIDPDMAAEEQGLRLDALLRNAVEFASRRKQ
jgi:hypothetical protein